MIANFLNANGFTRAAECTQLGLKACTALSAIEGVLFMALIAIRIAVIIIVYKR